MTDSSESVAFFISEIKATLSKTNDVGQVLTLFSSLVNVILNEKAKNDKQSSLIETLFQVEIEPKLKWNQKDASKIQVKLEFYRILAKLHVHFGNSDQAIKCYRKVLCRFISSITQMNFKRQFEKLNEDFDEGWQIVVDNDKVSQFMDVLQTILDRYESQNLPKEMVLYDQILMNKAEYLRSTGRFKESLAIDKNRLAVLTKYKPPKSEESWFYMKLPQTYYKVILDYHDLGQSKNCVKTAQILLKLFKRYANFYQGKCHV